RGGHYVVHPSDGLVEVYDTPNGIKLRSQLKGDEVNLSSRPLKWVDPVHTTSGETFTQLRDRLAGGNYAQLVRSNLLSPEQKQAIDSQLQAELATGNWQGGEAEILLPAEMAQEFMLEPGHELDFYST